MKNIAIFASGTGTNARKIIEYFENKPNIRVVLVVSNKAQAPVLGLAEEYGIDKLRITRPYFYESQEVLKELKGREVHLIVLAGFLWRVPPYLVSAYEKRMVNIHPALLPRHGGKGMYGMRVHQAVKEAGDEKTGITIHYVDEQYDEGRVIFQASCPVLPEDEPKDIARKVQQLEHRHFAPVIENILEPL